MNGRQREIQATGLTVYEGLATVVDAAAVEAVADVATGVVFTTVVETAVGLAGREVVGLAAIRVLEVAAAEAVVELVV